VEIPPHLTAYYVRLPLDVHGDCYFPREHYAAFDGGHIHDLRPLDKNSYGYPYMTYEKARIECEKLAEQIAHMTPWRWFVAQTLALGKWTAQVTLHRLGLAPIPSYQAGGRQW
jgi:hypothetical protein